MTPGEHEDQPSPRVVEQRIRNWVIEYFDWVSSYEEQRRYQAAVPAVSVAGEVFEQWDDWTPEPMTEDRLGAVYSPAEIEAMLAYDRLLARALGGTPDVWQPMAIFQALPVWEELRRGAAAASAVFARRGALPEDHEV